MAMNETIAKIRKEKGITQQEMAKDLYVTRQAVSRWDGGDFARHRYGEADLRHLQRSA